MKFKDGEIVFCPDKLYNGTFPTENKIGTIIGYNKAKGKYLVEFEDYVGGFSISFNGYETKVGKGLYVDERDLQKISMYKELVETNLNDEE